MNKPLIIDLPINVGYLWFIYGVIVLIYLIMSLIFIHHWSYYGVQGNNKVFVKSLYFIGGIILLALLASFIVGYSYIN